LAIYVCRNSDLWDFFKNLKEIPLVLKHEFYLKSTDEEIFEYFLDKTEIYFEYRKKNEKIKLTATILNVLQKIEENEYESTTFSKILLKNENISKEELLKNLKNEFEEIENKIFQDLKNIWKKKYDYKNPSFEHAPYEIRNDFDVAKCAVEYHKNFKFVSEDLKQNDKFIDEISKFRSFASIYTQILPKYQNIAKYGLRYALQTKQFNCSKIPKDLWKNEDFICRLFTKFPAKSAFWYIEDNIGNNKELILKLLKFKSFEVASIHVLLRDDRDIALKSVTYFPERYKYFSKKLQEDFEIIKETFKRDFPSSLYNYLPEYIKNDPKLASELIRFSPNFYFYLDPIYQSETMFRTFLQHAKPATFQNPYLEIPKEFQMNQELLEYGISFKIENIFIFSPHNPGFMKSVLLHLENFKIQNIRDRDEKSGIYFWFDKIDLKNVAISYHLLQNKEFLNFFSSKIFLFQKIYLGKSISKDLNLISLEDYEKELMMLFSMKLRGIYEKIIDKKMNRFKDIYFHVE